MRKSVVPVLALAIIVSACGGGDDEAAGSTENTLASLSAGETESTAGETDPDDGGGDGEDGAAGSVDGISGFYQDFLTTYDEARMTGETSKLADMAAVDIVARAERWHANNQEELADEVYSGATGLTSTANVVEIKDRSGRTEIFDCTEEREDKEAAASGLPGYHYIEQAVVISGTEGAWMVDSINVLSTGLPATGLTCVPAVHRQPILDFLPRVDAALDEMVANPGDGVTSAVQEMTNENLHPLLSQSLDFYVQNGVAPDVSDVGYKYRIVGADTDIDQRIARVERCARLPDGEKFRSLDTGELVDMSAQGARSGELTWTRTYFVLFTDAFSDEFEYRLHGVGDEQENSDCWTSPEWN